MTEFPAGVVAVVRAHDPATGRVIVDGLRAGGVRNIEITTTVPNWAAIVSHVVQAAAGPVGVGTVLDPAAVGAASAAGATFVVAPNLDETVVLAARRAGLPVAVGALTPTEVRRAESAGADVVKVFPVGSLGGVRYIRELRGPFPDIPLIVSGGVSLAEVGEYFDTGVHAVCLGGALIDQAAATSRDVDGVAAHAAAALASIGA